MDLINDRTESNAKRRVQEYESDYNMHTVERHGPEIYDIDMKQRSIDGTNPTTGASGPIRPSSQFTNYRIQMNVINDALTRQANTI